LTGVAAGNPMLRGLRIDLSARSPVVARHVVAGTALPPMRVVVLSDVHCGGWWATREMLDHAVDLANAESPDLAVFAGDAVADRMLPWRRVPPETIAAGLARLRAPLGTWAVLGNHDWKDDAVAHASGSRTCRAWAALEAAGIPVLHNHAVPLGGTWLVGVDSRRARWAHGPPGLDDPDAAFAAVPAGAPSILVAHEPDIFAEDARATLQISGHTHGGQIAPFGWTPVVPSDYGSRFAWGHYRDGGRHLVVSGGLGFVGIPLRVGRPPEITVIDVREEEP
jgi:predicted MPP superfamily phosphohydrolase